MKNTNFKTSAVAISPTPPKANAPDGCRVVNMRQEQTTGGLAPTGIYSSSSSIKGVPLLYMVWQGSDFIFSWQNGKLWVWNGMNATAVAEIQECPKSAVSHGDTALFMLSGAPPLKLKPRKVTGGYTIWDDISSSVVIPKVRFVCTQKTKLAATTNEFTLSGEYAHWTGPMTDSDINAITASLADVYKRLAEQARTQNLLVQPVMLWWRLLDEYGRVAHRSTPVLMSASGIQGMERIEAKVHLQGSYFKKVGPATMSVQAYLPAVSVYGVSAIAGTVEVMMTPPLETVRLDGKGKAGIRFNGSTATEASLLMSPAQAAPARFLVESVLDRLDEISTVVLRLPANETSADVSLTPVRLRDTLSEQSTLMSAISKAAKASAGFISECSLPHSFSAAAAVAVGDMALWGDITPVRCRAASVAELATETDSTVAWAGASAAELTTGESFADTDSAQNNAPLKLSALIAYPLGSCKKITLQLSSATTAGRRSCGFDCQATSSGRWAFFLNENMEPLNPNEWGLADVAIQAVDSGSPTAHPSTVLAASASDPTNVECGITFAAGRVKGITPAARTQSAWDFARRHLYVFTDSLIYSLAVNSKRTLCSAHMIYNCGVDSAEKVASAPQGVYAATTAGQIICVAGSTAKEVKRYADCVALGWSVENGGELWCAQADNSCLLIDTDGRETELTELKTRWFAGNEAGKLWLINADGALIDTSVSLNNTLTNVIWSHQIRVPGQCSTASRLHHIDWDFHSAMATGTLTIKGHNGNPSDARVLGGFSLNGAVEAPLRLLTPQTAPLRYIVVEFTGSVTNDTRLGILTLTFASHNGNH
ncbi:MAG: hypothetical protein NC343_00665 [Muribaculum sp.]|nr:hypothetical protein [Muribaculaceae bacterium]MCM1080247.1 hypothetical protein [Muribaculum sp.]